MSCVPVCLSACLLACLSACLPVCVFEARALVLPLPQAHAWLQDNVLCFEAELIAVDAGMIGDVIGPKGANIKAAEAESGVRHIQAR